MVGNDQLGVGDGFGMGTPLLVRGDARCLPLADESVDLVVTSPPYWALRSYSDDGDHYDGQIGAEPTAQQYLDELIACTKEWARVLKPTGSMWVNLGDKYVSDNRGSGTDRKRGKAKYAPAGSGGFAGRELARQKSLMLLPHRYAIRCMDELGLIVRQDQVWEKPNGLPESVTDRTRRSHEYLFHMVKQSRYYSSTDDIRVPHAADTLRAGKNGSTAFKARNVSLLRGGQGEYRGPNPLGSLPGSVWEVASQPLNVPDHVAHARCCGGRKRVGCEAGLDHYAAWPFALVRPVILGWSPLGGVVVDPFGGTGSAALVAAMAGRVGVSVDASWDYCDVIARWRVGDPRERARAAGVDPDAVAQIPVVGPQQGSLFG